MPDLDGTYDVVVVGGGVAGTAAAVAAARNGAKTLLVERNGFLGGWQTAGLVSHLSAWLDGDKEQIVFGFPDEVMRRLIDAGGSVGLLKVGKGMVHHDPEILKLVLEETAVEAGVEPLYYAEFFQTLTQDGRVCGVEVLTRSGMVSLPAKMVVDASGDAVAAISAGARYEQVPRSKYMAATLMFVVSNADTPRVAEYIRDHPEEFSRETRFWHFVEDRQTPFGPRLVVGGCGFSESIDRAKANGDLPSKDQPNFMAFMSGGTPPGVYDFNAIFLSGVDWHDNWALTSATVEARRRSWRLVGFLRNYIPGFEHAHLTSTAPQLAIREARRIVGDYTLEGKDILRGTVFPDAVVRGFFPLDVAGGDEHKMEEGDKPYTIPYRCLLPRGVENLLAVGRSISATQESVGSARISTISMLCGQAAGSAAALAVQSGATARQVDVSAVQESLKQQNALHLS
jgi:hypothetical protein